MPDLYAVANAYKEACAKIEQLIKSSRYKITYVMEEIGLGRAAFYARLNAHNWEPEHLIKFARLLQPERVEGAV